MSIIWLIIKIILFIVLILLLAVVGIVAVVLLAPIRYEVYFEKYEQLHYEVKVRYLRYLRGHFILEDGKVHHRIILLGKMLYELNEQEEALSDETAEELEKKPKVTFEKDKLFTVKETVSAKKVAKKPNNQKIVKLKNKKIEKPTLAHEVEEEIIETGEYIKKGNKEVLEEGLGGVKTYVLNRTFFKVIRSFFKLCKQLISYIAPYEWSFELIVGQGEAADTGELMAKLIMLYPLYYKHGIIKGNYESSGIWGGLLAEGRFRLIGILRYLIIFLCQKATRDYINLILKTRKDERHGE